MLEFILMNNENQNLLLEINEENNLGMNYNICKLIVEKLGG
jgi:hypothetical protein